MANTPHGGTLKVGGSCLDMIVTNSTCQDLVARDENISSRLKEEAATLPDIFLTEVCLSYAFLQAFLMGSC
jgi:hypothetical protein